MAAFRMAAAAAVAALRMAALLIAALLMAALLMAALPTMAAAGRRHHQGAGPSGGHPSGERRMAGTAGRKVG